MRYPKIQKAVFIRRPNRFIAHCGLNGQEIIAHVPNTGRCQELLLPGATIYLAESDNPKRKTACSLVAVEKGKRLINIDSQAPNKVVKEALEEGRLLLPGWTGNFQLKRYRRK